LVRRLPVFRGYTVDRRLREFRRIEFGEVPEFVPFDSEKGRKVMAEMRQGPCKFCRHIKGKEGHERSGNQDCRCSCNH
jgi:hypothetical protein